MTFNQRCLLYPWATYFARRETQIIREEIVKMILESQDSRPLKTQRSLQTICNQGQVPICRRNLILQRPENYCL